MKTATARMHTLQATLRELSSRASNPNIDALSRATAKRSLSMMRDQFNDATLIEAIDYPEAPALGWAIPRDSDGNLDTDRFSVCPVSPDMLPACD
jgi:hypothetical protein